jgi:hypothetical protein
MALGHLVAARVTTDVGSIGPVSWSIPCSAAGRAELISSSIPLSAPSNALTWCSRVRCWMISASGCRIGSRVLLGWSSILQ